MSRLYITKASDAGILSVNVTFNDNTSRVVNLGDFIRRHPHPQYNKYLDECMFEMFTIEEGSLVCGKNWGVVFPVEDLYNGVIK